MRKVLMCIALAVIMITNVFAFDVFKERNIGYAQGNEIKILMLGYFEYWVDDNYKYDDVYGRHSVENINGLLYDVGFKTPEIAGYKFKNLEVYKPFQEYGPIERWYDTEKITEAEIDKFDMENLDILNENDLIGYDADGKWIMIANLTPLPTNKAKRSQAPNGMTVYRSYMPILYTVEKVGNSILNVNFLDEKTGEEIRKSEKIELNFLEYNLYPIPEIQDYTFRYWKYDNGAKNNENPVNIFGYEGEHTLDVYYKGRDNPFITCWGEGEPNPAVLKDGKATISVKVNAEAFNINEDILMGDPIDFWILTLQMPNGSKLDRFINTSSKEVNATFPLIMITGDTVFPISAKAVLKSGKMLDASNTVKILVTVEGEYDITAKLWTDPWPATIDVSKYDYENNIPQKFNLDLDAIGSEASLGIDAYQYSWWIDKKNIWEGDWVKEDILKLTDLTLYPDSANSSKEITIEGSVAVKDTAGHIRYARDSSNIKLNIISNPPETEIEIPYRSYAKEITDNTSLKNIAKWSFFSEDGAAYKHSIVSLYKWNGMWWTPVFANQIQTERQLEIRGNENEIFKIVENVVDEYGTVSNTASGIIYIETAKPDLDVTLDYLNIKDNILGIEVTNTTHPEIEALYPSSYTTWNIKDAKGTVLASGTGKAPSQVHLDNAYIGTAAVVEQEIKNILNNTAKDKAIYKSNSNLEIDIVPNRLFETEYASITNNARGLKNQSWSIKLNHEAEYQDFVFEDDKFTRPKGFYNVKSEGSGVTVLGKELYKYSNNIADLLRDDYDFNQAEIKAAFGDEYSYALNSQYWSNNVNSIEEGNFESLGYTYKFRRKANLSIYKTSEFLRIKDVEFLNGKSASYFEIKADEMKAFKKIELDGSKSVDYTDSELQEKYPIQFDHERTRFIIEPITALEGEVDYSKNDLIKGEGKQIVNGRVTFPAKMIQNLRVDGGCILRISYITYNGLKDSDPFIREIVINPELPPTVDINIASPVVYRDPEQQLKAFLHVTVLYNSVDGDQIDLDRSFLTVQYSENKDNNFLSDPGMEGTVKKDQDNLPSHITITNKKFFEDRAVFSFAVDSPEKNSFGKYKFEFEVIEKPSVPNFNIDGDIPVSSTNTELLDNAKKITLVDNTAPSMRLETSRNARVELWYIDTVYDGDIGNEDIRYIFDTLELNEVYLEDFYYIDLNGKVTLYQKKDNVITSSTVSE